MVRFKFLLVVGTIAVLTLGAVPSTAAFAGSAQCTPEQIRTKTCPPELVSGGTVDDDSVDLYADGTETSGGTGTGTTASGGSAEDPAEVQRCGRRNPMSIDIEWVPCDPNTFTMLQRHPEWTGNIEEPDPACTLCSPDTIVRVSDLENFLAYPAPTGMKPNGWAIVGLAANFWTDASAQIGDGLLLGEPAQVMFTPIGYHWDYGDGTTTTAPTGGASWEALGLVEFSTTPTSHKYAARGTYTVVLTVVLTVEYHADYSFGDQGWRPVEGIVTVPSAPFTVGVWNESTVLVAEDCLTNPHGPGC